jgi:CRISPR-associated protein Csb2
MRVLLFQVNLLHPVWHGRGDWPPSPFRLFQAMVAGAFGGRWMAEDRESQEQRTNAFRWLERLDAPRIALPPRASGYRVMSYVPNNDRDSGQIEDIRVKKEVAPTLLESGQSFLYAWPFDEGEREAAHLCHLIERLHTFGWGIDPAWARGDVLDSEDADACLSAHGAVARPTGMTGANPLPCPDEGSVDSLIVRHAATIGRFTHGHKTLLFRQPPKAHYRQSSYDRPPLRLHFDIREVGDLRRFFPISQLKVATLTESVRDRAAQRLGQASIASADLVERYMVGRGANRTSIERRVRIIPLPTIGHPHASPSIRRISVEIPPDCPISVRDVEWAFVGLAVENDAAVLVPAESDDMPSHYGFDEEFSQWRSVTPVALPAISGKGRNGTDRSRSEVQTAVALANALRHAGVAAKLSEVRIQREPFHPKGALADLFEPSRFAGRLRHLEVGFDRPIRGPLLIGDGRFVGLGLMRPC